MAISASAYPNVVALYKRGVITGEVCLERCHYPSDMREKMMALLSQQESEEQSTAT